MRLFAIVFGFLALITALPATAEDRNILLSGSTTLVPIISNAANRFMDQHPTWRSVHPDFPDSPVSIEISAGGSGQGVRSVLDDVAHAGMVSRELRDSELERLGDHELVLVGIDAVAVAAHRDNPLFESRSDLSRGELEQIFSGEAATYARLDGDLPDREIVLLVRDASAGSAVMIQRQVLGETPVSPRALQMNSQGQLVRNLMDNPLTFAYISLGLVNANDSLKAFSIDGIEPSHANVVSGAYELARPMYLVTREIDNPYLQSFLEFLLSSEGQEIVREQGYIPVGES